MKHRKHPADTNDLSMTHSFHIRCLWIQQDSRTVQRRDGRKLPERRCRAVSSVRRMYPANTLEDTQTHRYWHNSCIHQLQGTNGKSTPQVKLRKMSRVWVNRDQVMRIKEKTSLGWSYCSLALWACIIIMTSKEKTNTKLWSQKKMAVTDLC